MKYVIDLVDDIRESINNEDDFLMGVIALEKDLDKNENNTIAWGKAINSVKLVPETKRLEIYVGNETPLQSDTFINAMKELSNEAMMYEVFVSTIKQPEEATQALLGFSEDLESKKYMLLIEE